jgi:hypothetical protein
MTKQIDWIALKKVVDIINKRIKKEEYMESIGDKIHKMRWSYNIVYGKKRGKEIEAYNSIVSYLKYITTKDIYKSIPKGEIIKSAPTEEYCIKKLKALAERAYEYFDKKTDWVYVTDNWAKRTVGVIKGGPMNYSNLTHRTILESNDKRFEGKILTKKEKIESMIRDNKGILSEGHVIAFLNNEFECPECKNKGEIGWCDGITHKSIDAFRDAVCMSCMRKGVSTLFEIKTRWENNIKDKDKGTYTGNFAAINTLMLINVNVYLVLASRDTGDVRIGKITSAIIRGNENWLYSLQEGLVFGSPSSFVTCDKGFVKLPVKMSILQDILTDKYCKKIAEIVLLKLEIL